MDMGMSKQSQAEMSPRAFSVRERLVAEQATLERRLGEVHRALDLIAANPQVEELLTLLGRV